jgi:hypothetical protein
MAEIPGAQRVLPLRGARGVGGPQGQATSVPPTRMSLEDRLAAAVRRSLPLMPDSLATEIEQLLQPEALAVMAGVSAAWAISHFYGVGELADAVLLVVGWASMGGAAFGAARDLLGFVNKVRSAQTDSDLDDAAKLFAAVTVRLGSTAICALFFRARPKVYRGPAPALPLPPRSGSGLFYKPIVRNVPIRSRPGFITHGITEHYGDIRIDSRLLGDPSKYLHTLYHERVHQFLTPKFYPLRNVRVRIAIGGYQKSYILRYLEEALAEGVANLRMHGHGVIDAVTFPVKNQYVTVAKMASEVRGHLMGTVNVGGVIYKVLMTTGPHAVPDSR